ncbi:uncharacterized protein BYT42DRAFT_616285 [Radiomyces spectabilis]|uniref:uncharacterized protein n=1 Tax=Radiomyces spectabilis TaxID=64574 RepID=UPI00221FA686|nr:uncharacterized protein BYT42DRAFT_616285 [Radiomyces spectabilis]KAI8373105.1 hypothetical protein BYT42DRAFT_616285 [Radiomyces spectabilis]
MHADYESDDDYAPLTMASWGAQASKSPDPSNPTASWKSLVDPNFKIKAGGIGTGGLHRKGPNYKPVDEQYILNQRLNKAVPKASKPSSPQAKKAKKPKAPAKVKPTTRSELVATKPAKTLEKKNLSQIQNILDGAKAVEEKKSRVPTRQRIQMIQSNVATAWGAAPLTSTPFWETSTTTTATNNNTSFSSSNTLQKTAISSTQTKTTTTVTTNTQPLSRTVSDSNPKPPSTFSKTTSSTSSEPSSSSHNSSNQQVSGGLVCSITEPKPVLQLEIEFAPGISALLPVYEHDDTETLVESFGRRHQLKMTDAAKSAVKQTIATLLQASILATNEERKKNALRLA